MRDSPMEGTRKSNQALLSFNEELVREFRSNHGIVNSNILREAGNSEGPVPCLILTMVGAKSLKPRMRPLGYFLLRENGERKFVVVGSRGGSDQHPQWYYNLLAHPEAIVEVGDETLRVEATLLEGQRREEIFKAASKRIPTYAKYQAMTMRELPVFLLEISGPEFGAEL